ncbi:MAG: M20/M25/M40 family metallo-hydrolase, partial [Candidatus Obscuribacterales bacterium]|nr:M20/M25/M40 family metallo-hydrolase [Candidatus Obscuribacterales bacterium]
LACNFVQSLQTLISRRKSALAPAVLTVGGIRSNTFRPNIVADEVELAGTIRYFEEGLSPFFEAEIRRMEKMLEAYGGKLSLKYQHENPTLVSDEQMTKKVKEAAQQMIGSNSVLDLPLELGSEDFSFYTSKIPSVFAIVGCGIEGSLREIHTSTFDIDENALIYGTSILAGGALKLAAQLESSSC